MIFQSFKMALKAIAGNKMRSFLTILGVVIGVLAIVVLVSIGQGANSSVSRQHRGHGHQPDLRHHQRPADEPRRSADGLNELAENEAIAYIAPHRPASPARSRPARTPTTTAMVQGTAPGYEQHPQLGGGRRALPGQQPDIDNRSFVAVIGCGGRQRKCTAPPTPSARPSPSAATP